MLKAEKKKKTSQNFILWNEGEATSKDLCAEKPSQ